MKCGSDGNFTNMFHADGKYQNLSPDDSQCKIMVCLASSGVCCCDVFLEGHCKITMASSEHGECL
jgi:hypothetical protein